MKLTKTYLKSLINECINEERMSPGLKTIIDNATKAAIRDGYDQTIFLIQKIKHMVLQEREWKELVQPHTV